MTAASGAPKIATRNVTKIYPSVAGNVTVVDDFSLDVADGEFVCIVGPSGCGKSSTIRTRSPAA
jgi:NitT/TauT family transport system ATP-binding protein